MHRFAVLSLILSFGLWLTACKSQAFPSPDHSVPSVSPILTDTRLPPSITPTTAPPLPTATSTSLPPTATVTSTPLPPTATSTKEPTEIDPYSAEGEAGEVTIKIAGFRFSPGVVEIKAGSRVVWNNQDGSTHTVTSDTGVFDSGSLGDGDSFAFTFTEVGTYTYHCNIHHSMKGTIKVVP